MKKIWISVLLIGLFQGCGSTVGDNRHSTDINKEIGIQENLDNIGNQTPDTAVVDKSTLSKEQETLMADENDMNTAKAEASDIIYPATIEEGIE